MNRNDCSDEYLRQSTYKIANMNMSFTVLLGLFSNALQTNLFSLPVSRSSEVPAKRSSSSSSSSGRGLIIKQELIMPSVGLWYMWLSEHKDVIQNCKPWYTHSLQDYDWLTQYRGKSSSCHSSLSSTPSILRRASVVATDSWRSRLGGGKKKTKHYAMFYIWRCAIAKRPSCTMNAWRSRAGLGKIIHDKQNPNT